MARNHNRAIDTDAKNFLHQLRALEAKIITAEGKLLYVDSDKSYNAILSLGKECFNTKENLETTVDFYVNQFNVMENRKKKTPKQAYNFAIYTAIIETFNNISLRLSALSEAITEKYQELQELQELTQATDNILLEDEDAWYAKFAEEFAEEFAAEASSEAAQTKEQTVYLDEKTKPEEAPLAYLEKQAEHAKTQATPVTENKKTNLSRLENGPSKKSHRTLITFQQGANFALFATLPALFLTNQILKTKTCKKIKKAVKKSVNNAGKKIKQAHQAASFFVSNARKKNSIEINKPNERNKTKPKK